MAKLVQDREDLLRDATGFSVRGKVLFENVEWFLGFRNETAVSVYVDQESVFQFNRLGELRRAFFQGRRLSAERGSLVALRRVKDQESRLRLQATPIEASFRNSIDKAIESTGGSLRRIPAENWTVVGCDRETWQAKVNDVVNLLSNEIRVAAGPHSDIGMSPRS